MARIFVSYRREDSAAMVGRIHEHLTRRFGSGDVFRDIGSIGGGHSFADTIHQALQQCEVVLAVIGPRWLPTLAEREPAVSGEIDHHRLELVTALAREVLLIPVLIGETVMPRIDQLPADLVAIARLHAMRVRPDPDFGTDLALLASAIAIRLHDDDAVFVPPRPRLDDPRQLEAWTPEIRRSLLVFEALSDLRFVVAESARVRLEAFGRILIEVSAPPDALFVDEVEGVLAWSAARKEREHELPSPREAQRPFWTGFAALVADRRPKTRLLLEAATDFAAVVQTRFKHAFGIARPVEWATQVMPSTASAGGCFPMGTAIESYAVAVLIEALAGERSVSRARLRRAAHRASENQIVAGHNFPVDALVGRSIGLVLGDYLLARCGRHDAVQAVSIRGESLRPATDLPPDGTPEAAVVVGNFSLCPVSHTLAAVWAQARAEWA